MKKSAVVTVFLASVLMGACASKTQMPLAIKEPSEIDPKNPPSIEVLGISNGDLIQKGKELKFTYQIHHYPVGENYQKIAFRLNDSPPIVLTKAKGEVEFKKELKSGVNILRVYLLRSWGESIKVPTANLLRAFYYSERIGVLPAVDSMVVLTLVSPSGLYAGELSKKILFDFLLQGNPKAVSTVKSIRYKLNRSLLELPVGKAGYFEHLPVGKYTLQVDLSRKTAIGTSLDLGRDQGSFEISEKAPE